MSGHPAVQQALRTITSSLSASLDSLSLPKLNPIEPPWYGPVCPVVWEGGAVRRPPIPINPQYARRTKNCQSSASYPSSGPHDFRRTSQIRRNNNLLKSGASFWSGHLRFPKPCIWSASKIGSERIGVISID